LENGFILESFALGNFMGELAVISGRWQTTGKKWSKLLEQALAEQIAPLVRGPFIEN
jgi:hypothetical protein